MFSIPSPSSGHRSANRPSRQENASKSLTRIWWLTSAPIAHTIGSCSRRIVNTGPNRRSCSSSSPSGSEMTRRVLAQLGAVLPAGSAARRRTRRSRRTSPAMRCTSRISGRAGGGAPIVRVGVRTWTSAIARVRYRAADRRPPVGVRDSATRDSAADDDDPHPPGDRRGKLHAGLRAERDAGPCSGAARRRARRRPHTPTR